MASSSFAEYFDASIKALAEARAAFDDERIARAVGIIVGALGRGQPLLICGNGGSAADAQHITGELVGQFLRKRRALNAVCLVANPAVLTAWANDFEFNDVFARQVEAHAVPGAVLLAISTSGNSENVVRAAITARKLGLPVVSLTGRGGGRLAPHTDVLLDVPSSETPYIQQVHICLYHFICKRIEEDLAGP